MNDSNQTQSSDVDLLDFIKKLWLGKKIIFILIFITVLFGSLYSAVKEPEYESKIFYSVQTRPPFYSFATAVLSKQSTKIMQSQFQKIFYSKSTFEEWKKDNKSSIISFEDFTNTQSFQGFVFYKDQDQRLATLVSGAGTTGAHLLARTNNLELLNDFYNYTIYVNNILKYQYIAKAQYELDVIISGNKKSELGSEHTLEEINEIKKKSLTESTMEDVLHIQTFEEEQRIRKQGLSEQTVNKVLSLKEYILRSNDGADVFNLQRPTIPEIVSARFSLILTMSIIFGFVVGISFVLLKSSIQNRKN